jgi:hypothetical protein
MIYDLTSDSAHTLRVRRLLTSNLGILLRG